MKKIHFIIIFTALYILGILAFNYNLFLNVSLFVISLLVIICWKLKFKVRYAFIGYLFFLFAFFNTSIQLKAKDNLSLLFNKEGILQGTISSIPSNNNFNKTSFFVNVDTVNTQKQSYHDIKSKLYLTINANETKINKYQIGDKIEFRGKIKKPYKIGNPNQFNYAKFLKYKKTFTIMFIDEKDCEITGVENNLKWKFLRKINNLRLEIINKQAKYIKSPNIEILGGIVFGDDAVNPPQYIKETFVTTGLLHILAASGMNVAFIFSMMFFILSFFKIPYRINIITSAITVIIYAAMTGFPPSIIRALIMLEFVILGKLINKEANSLSLLSFAALIMLIISPTMLFNISFQLSFIVTFGIILFAPVIYEFLNNKNKFCSKLTVLFIPIIAQIFVIPLQMYYFQTFSTYSLFANILILPFLSIISFLGFINSILNLIPFFYDFINLIFSYILNPAISILIGIAKMFANMNNALLSTYKMNFYQIVFYYSTIIFLYLTLKNNPRKIKNYVIICVCLIILCGSFIKIPNKNFETVFFDVQNGDCILLKTPQNKYIMIDSGRLGYKTNYSQINSIVIPYLKEKRVKEIDTFIITHFDSDHAGGAIELLKNFKVNRVILPDLDGDSILNRNIKEYVLTNKIPYSVVKNEDMFYKENDFNLTNFYVENKNKNESSIVTLAEHENYKILFCADVTEKVLNKMNLPKDINVIKIGHHGAIGTISKEFLNKHNVKHAIISVGHNQYNHPHQNTIETLKSNNTNIYRTDLDNAVKLVKNRKDFSVFLYSEEKDNWQKVRF